MSKKLPIIVKNDFQQACVAKKEKKLKAISCVVVKLPFMYVFSGQVFTTILHDMYFSMPVHDYTWSNRFAP